MLTISILYFEGCPNHPPAVELAREVVTELQLDVTVNEVKVLGPEDAQTQRFFGSPSIHVNGVDIEPCARTRSDFGYSCRMYAGKGLPPKDMLIAAIRRMEYTSNITPNACNDTGNHDCCESTGEDRYES
jgi:hypothetical protein